MEKKKLVDIIYEQFLIVDKSVYITAMEVAESATGPNPLRLIFLNNVLHHLVLLWGLYGHQVHAHAPADVPGVQPPNLTSNMHQCIDMF